MNISYIISSIGNSQKLEELINKILINARGAEVLLIDNSKNQILDKYSLNSKIKYFHEKQPGLSRARNRGAKEAGNGLLVFLDDDIIPEESFFEEISKIKTIKNLNAIIGGKIVPNTIPNNLPNKYHYLVGEKDLGEGIKKMRKYSYIGGCVLIMPKHVYEKLNGFNEKYGHSGKQISANEDVLLQDLAHNNGIDVIYNPNLIVHHYWHSTMDMLYSRVKIQGVSDRAIDIKYHKIRFILRLIKYIFFIIFNNKKTDMTIKFDIMRYKSYVYNKTNI